ncbi:MAG: helix-turn-helix domain-containing protein [Spirochaetaceae bacterium]|jgi:AraC-like DNA-binding protein/ligand-binding sensor protein|nr:helix-turn-helix domain-containing protein [Spirochaetaceae bacterium]
MDYSYQSGIINRREVKPLLMKAYEVLASYQQAADCMVAVMDQAGRPVEIVPYKGRPFLCELCKKHCQDVSRVWGEREYPCNDMHTESMFEAHRVGGTYIYTCELGLIFWSSVLYSGGRQVGAINAGHILLDPQEAVHRISAMSRGAVSEAEAHGYITKSRSGTYEEIKALAQMLGFCAEQISTGMPEPPVETLTKSSAKPPAGRMQKAEKKPAAYPLDKERLLLAALRRGDYENARKILRELLEGIVVSKSGNFEFIQLRAIELAVILSREALRAGREKDSAEYRTTLEVNNRYLKKIQESKTLGELIDILYGIVDCIGGQIFSFQGIRHASALRKAERFIWEHYTRKLSLQEIAEVSGLSASYFSSIFKEEMGENLSSYLNRLRVEKATGMLTETDLSLNEISGACGFEDQSWFSKIFKSYIGVSPGKYREQGVGVYADCQSNAGILQ